MGLSREQKLALVRNLVYVVVFLLAGALAVYMIASKQEDEVKTIVTVGTGSISGLYYPTGGAIAKFTNRKAEQYGFRVVVEATDGSLENLTSILGGTLDTGIVQADVEHEAVKGTGEWYIKGPQDDLRAICSLHQEMITLMATDASGVWSLADLEGKKVGIGVPGSGNHKNAVELLEAVGLDWESDIDAVEVKIDDAVGLLREGALDALFYTTGHPTPLVVEALNGQEKCHFVPITGVDGFMEANPYFLPAEIPRHLYLSSTNTEAVPTIAMMAVLVTSADVDDRFVYAVTYNLFQNLDEIKTLHPSFELFSRDDMLKGFTAPIHDGAMRYFKQTGEDDLLQPAGSGREG